MSGVFLGILAAQSAPLSVVVSPTSLYKSRVGNGSITSDPATGSASGGTPGYTYAWTYVSGSSYTINSPSSAATTFTTTVSVGSSKTGTYRCTVTDGVGGTAYFDITVDFEAF